MFCALTVLILVMPNTKHIASKILDLPLPLSPVMELKLSSHPLITVRTAYDLKPSMISSTTFMAKAIRFFTADADLRNRNATKM